MKTRLTIVCIILVVVGLYLNFDFYQNTVHHLNLANKHLSDIATSSDHTLIQTHLFEIKHNLMEVMERLPENKNPVWIFPTETTNFARMQSDLDVMIVSVEKISTIPKDSSAYYTGMLDIDQRSLYIQENIVDAKGFLYASAANVFFTLVWLIGVTGITKMWIENEN